MKSFGDDDELLLYETWRLGEGRGMDVAAGVTGRRVRKVNKGK